jgi:Siphovirus Gp157
MALHNDITYLKSLIEELKINHPELADDDDLRADVFEGETDLHSVLERLVSAAIEADTWAGAVKTRCDELMERQKRFSDKNDVIRNLILSIMERANLPKIQLVEATLSMRKIAPSPIVTDIDLLPDNCVKIERRADMAAIKAAIEVGEVLGVVMSNGKTSLTIRIK